MKVLVLGASGATGRLVVRQLLERGIAVRTLIREGAVLSEGIDGNPLLEILRGNIAAFDAPAMTGLLRDCDAVVSCLGHRTTLRGLFGKPRDLVAGALRMVCRQLAAGDGRPVKLILMGTTAYEDTRSGEKYAAGDRIILGILKLLLPPHRDNVRAADFLAGEIGRDSAKLEWVTVRPDTLVDREAVSAYTVQASPVRSPVSNAGKTSRINVSHFMSELLTDERLWAERRFTMPVLYGA